MLRNDPCVIFPDDTPKKLTLKNKSEKIGIFLTSINLLRRAQGGQISEINVLLPLWLQWGLRLKIMVFELRRRLIEVRKIPIFRIFLKESVFLCIVRENDTGVVAEHLNRSKVKSYFFVNKNYRSGVLTYLWERDVA